MGRRGHRGQPRRPSRRPTTTRTSTATTSPTSFPKQLCLSEDQPGYLSCRHCLNKKSGRSKTFPTSVGAVTRPTPSWLSSCSLQPLACRQRCHQGLQPRPAPQCLPRRFLWRLLERRGHHKHRLPSVPPLVVIRAGPEDSLAFAAPYIGAGDPRSSAPASGGLQAPAPA